MRNQIAKSPVNSTSLLAGDHVIKSFFEQYPTPTLQEKLWDFYMAKRTLGKPFYYGSPSDDLIFYEDLSQLLERLQVNYGSERLEVLVAPPYMEQTLISVEGVVNFIKQVIPVGTIYNLAKQDEDLDLIIVLEKTCAKAYTEYDGIIDLSLLGYQHGTCTVHNYGLLNTLITKGHFFYATACVEANVVYRKSSEEIFPKVDLTSAIRLQIENLFESGMDKAANFYKGAQHYMAIGENEMAIFMLQQTTELAYRCLLNVLRGRDVKCHSPAILRKHLKRFAPEVIGIFSKNEEEELGYLKELEDAYVKSRYEADYEIDPKVTVFLMERVCLLQATAHQLFAARMAILNEFV